MSAAPDILLLPVDGSEGAAAAAATAAALADRLGIPVRLLFAYPKDPAELFASSNAVTNPGDLEFFPSDAFDQLRDRAAAKAFHAAREAMSAFDVPVEEVVLSGEPAGAIVQHANATSNPMIVMGSRGLGELRELLIGSVSQRVLHHARCPVTLVR